FITDITNNPNDRSGDWQFGNDNNNHPTDVYGTWKSGTNTIDHTKAVGKKVTYNGGNDPATNHWNLGAGADPVPSGLVDQGFGAEVVWAAQGVGGLGLLHGHVYRLEFMVHDGDQNNSGGDVGEACANMYIP